MSFNEVTRSIKVRFYPDDDQKDLSYQNMGCTGLVHNYMLNAMENDYKIIKGREFMISILITENIIM